MDLLKLFHVSRFMDLNGGVLIQPAGMDARRSLALFTLAGLLHTDKCLLAGAGDREQLQLHFNMLEMVFGGKEAISAKPRVLAIVNTTSPLQMDEFALETLIQFARRGQPVMISPTVMAGSTGPVTLAGTMVLSNAEALAGVALTQMVRPGCPVVYGCQSTASDMRTGGISSGAPERALCIRCGGMLARHLGIPYRSGGADNDAPILTPQAAAESMMNLMASVNAGVDLVVHAAGILGGFAAVSLEKAVFDLEIISRLRRWQQGVSCDATELAEEVIRQVGIGGEYLTSRHTFEKCRKALWIPEVSPNEPLGGWADAVRDISRCTEKAAQMIGQYQVPARDMKLEKALLDLMQEHDYPEDLLSQLVPPPG
jgi:trimethylamine--corrinoid protein Co-methyltransferase